MFLLDENGKPVRSEVTGHLLKGSVLAIFCNDLKRRVDYDLQHDIRSVAIMDTDERTKTAIGQTVGRMLVTGVATKLISVKSGWGPGVGGALLDYRFGGKATRNVVLIRVRMVLQDFATVDLEFNGDEFKQFCAA